MAIHSQFTGLEIHEPYNFVQETDPGAVGSNLYWLKVSTGQIKRRKSNNSGWDDVGGSSGVTEFTGLTDAPSSYTGQANKVVTVKADESGLEFTASSGGLTLISQTVLGGTAANISIVIPGGYKDLVCSGLFRSDNANTFDELRVNFNADATDANYLSSIMFSGSTSGGSNNSYGDFGNSSGATSTSGYASGWTTEIVNYLGTTFNKTWQGFGTSARATGTHYTFSYGGVWINTAAITGLLVKPKFGTNWIAGTVLNIWGRK